MKYVAIRKEPNGMLYMDKWFFDRYSDSDLSRYGYKKVQVPSEFEDDFVIEDFNHDTLLFDVGLYSQRKEKQNLARELDSLVLWFEEYDNQVNQYQRCVRLGVSFDKDIEELDNQAKTNQERIREIRLILK